MQVDTNAVTFFTVTDTPWIIESTVDHVCTTWQKTRYRSDLLLRSATKTYTFHPMENFKDLKHIHL